MARDQDETPEILPVEQDDRFPSGEWTGFFLQPGSRARAGWS